MKILNNNLQLLNLIQIKIKVDINKIKKVKTN